MNEKHIHIVTHDVPWPADFGGVIDIYYKIKWLHAEGVKIHLHCFVKTRPATDQLNKYCETVDYYPRKKNLNALSFSLPYIVQSRNDESLLTNLRKDNYPILFEGIHSTFFLKTLKDEGRKTYLRLFNTEHKYYASLAKNETNILKRIYYLTEARLLKKYERKIALHTHVWALSTADADHYKVMFGAPDVHFLPVFLPWENVSGKEGNGKHFLYHANLSVNENEQAAIWLIKNVFNDSVIPLIIAGLNPSERLKRFAARHAHISINANPTEPEMQSLIENAHVNVVPSLNNTGVKLKLLNALFNGRHCLVNPAGAEGSETEELCNIAKTAADMKKDVVNLFATPYTEKIMQHRSAALKDLYNNQKNALRVIAWIW